MTAAPLVAIVPGPLGQLALWWMFVRDPLDSVVRIQRRWGDAVVTTWPGQTFVQVTDPTEATRVLRELRDVVIKDLATRLLSEVVGDGLLTNEGAPWRRQRLLVAPSFRPAAIATYAERLHRCAARAAAAWPTGDATDVHPPSARLTLDMLTETVFGGDVPVDAARVEACLGRVMHTFHRITATWEALLPPSLQRRAMRRLRREKADLDAIVTDIVARRRARGTGGDDLLSRLVEARDDAGRGMDDDQLADEVLTLLLAGHETTALAIGYALWALAHDPDLQARARAEVRALPEPPGADAVRRLPLVRAIVLESLRLYPPAWIIGRELTAPATVAGRPCAPGTQIILPIWAIHRDPRWFPEPERFRPDRWLDGSADRAPAGAFLPFGDGPRVCVGQHFAMLEAVIALAALLDARAFAPAPGATLTHLPSVTLRPRAGIVVGVSAA